ncbi:glycosyltransferase [Butyrivibrio sp. DSM 10294]|uniref:glycosyltransferase family 2 protein n=1 Tax=Butyrivibrio sp. DSM 10294 TaxID=2972457 RepID=UPI00234EC10A|nr:glycosyltransferase family 2 protein [Butyrivibrio sp. DSM 10294]MDC7293588.1 glycosyltransferase [Butyrivibrio sp. DSM 10294]
MKKISVILPCYNVEAYIDRALTSIEEQTIGFSSLEVICVNDCSTDATLSHLQQWESKYPENIMIIDLAVNSRQGTARNLGLEYSTCEYIAFVDSDDWLEKDYLEKLYNIALSDDYDIVQCRYIRDFSKTLIYKETDDSQNNPDEVLVISVPEDRKKFLVKKTINNLPHCKLIKKSLLLNNNIVFSEGLAYEDSYWGVLLNMYYTKAYILNEQLYHYYVNDVSTSLSTNEFYHVDLLTNQIMLWDELEERGFMDEYKEELEIEFVYSCALIFWKMIALRYDTPPYSLYRLLCALVKNHIPNILNNPHILNNELSELHLLILKSCLNILNKKEFQKFAQDLKTIGI